MNEVKESFTDTGASRLPKVSVGERPNSETLVKELCTISILLNNIYIIKIYCVNIIKWYMI